MASNYAYKIPNNYRIYYVQKYTHVLLSLGNKVEVIMLIINYVLLHVFSKNENALWYRLRIINFDKGMQLGINE